MTCEMPTAYPELSCLEDTNTQVMNTYHGYYWGQGVWPVDIKKHVIYTCFGEVAEDHFLTNVLTRLKDKFVIVVTNRDYSPEYESHFDCKILKCTNSLAWYTTMMPRSTVDFDRQEFDRYFLSLNNRASWPRHALAQFVSKYDLLDKFYFSYRFSLSYYRKDVDRRSTYDNMNHTVGPTWYNQGLDLEQLYNKLPIVTGLNDGFDTNDWSLGNTDYYHKSFASIINETYIAENFNVYLSEKTMKPLSAGHPFFVFGSAGVLAKLHELGFETFGDVFDESYDQLEQPWQRFEHILKEILRITSLDKHQLNTMYQHMRPRLERNYKYFWNDWHNKYLIEIQDIKQQIVELLAQR